MRAPQDAPKRGEGLAALLAGVVLRWCGATRAGLGASIETGAARDSCPTARAWSRAPRVPRVQQSAGGADRLMRAIVSSISRLAELSKRPQPSNVILEAGARIGLPAAGTRAPRGRTTAIE